MRYIFTILLLFSSVNYLIGQSVSKEYYQAYAEEIEGKRFTYHSPIPNVNSSLLIRGQDDYQDIEWLTERVSEYHPYDFVSFIWVFGMDVTSEPVDFHLSVNDKKIISFKSSPISVLGIRTFHGENGSELSLNTTMLDKYGDQMGFAILKIPVYNLVLGESAKIKIGSPTNNNNAWFMTFKAALFEEIDIYQNMVVAKENDNLYHSISVDFIHIGNDSKASISINGNKTETILKAGYNKLEILLPKASETTKYKAIIEKEGSPFLEREFELTPVKEWEIFLVQHTHTDIGYTRPQTEILPEHLRYIDNALDFCDQTDDYPDASKFRWTCETSWSLREYLKTRPQSQIDRLITRVKEGRIEATAMFLNFSEIVDESALAEQTKTLKMLKDNGFEISTAMQNDVNGIGWSVVDLFHNTDVKYLSMGIHAHRARKPFDKPTAFWWESPAGNRILAYRGEHYQHGNSLSLTTGQLDVLRTNLSSYLKSLDEKNYPYDKASLQFSGYITDNSPPSANVCDIIREWNSKYEWPKLRSSLARDFLVYLENEHSNELSHKKVAWPDWWTDGVGSAANETKTVRNTQAEMPAITSVLAMAKIMGVDINQSFMNDIEEVYDNLLFYDEHTHGAAESVSDPLAQNTVNQWGMKSAYAWEATKKAHALQEKVLAHMETALPKSNKPTIAVFNSLNWKRSAMVKVFLQYEIIPEGNDFTITDNNGKILAYHLYEQRMEGAYYGIWVDDVPPMGYKTLSINLGEKAVNETQNYSLLDNQYFKLTLDENNGVINSIFDKELNIELLDDNDSLSLGQFIYEQLANRHELERLTNSNRDTIYRPLQMSRTKLSEIKIIREQKGNIYNSIIINGKMPVCCDERGVDIEIRLYHHQKKIDILYSMFKLGITSPESVYISFPFKLNNGQLAFEAQGGVVYPGINQLEGSSADWNTIQNFASVRNSKSQIVFVSKEMPLVQFGDINTGRYYYRLNPKTNHIFSWVLNNYWVTNFKASQEGELRWTYSITSSDDNTDMFATKFGWGERTPLLTRIIFPDAEATITKLESISLIDMKSPNLLMVNAGLSMDAKSIILHLREVEGGHAILDIRSILEQTKASSAYEVNVLEKELKQLDSPFLIEHYETKFIKLKFED